MVSRRRRSGLHPRFDARQRHTGQALEGLANHGVRGLAHNVADELVLEEGGQAPVMPGARQPSPRQPALAVAVRARHGAETSSCARDLWASHGTKLVGNLGALALHWRSR